MNTPDTPPGSTPDIWEEIVLCRRRGEAAALATIVSTVGSTPGKDPMKMLVRGDGTFVGSVGGGCLEAEVWEHARTVMASLRPMTVSFTLTEKDYPDSGLICGGTLSVFIEPVTQPAVHVFGAGHVGLATARLAQLSGFRVSLYDDRPDMLDAARIGPDLAVVPGEFEATAAAALCGDLNFVLVVTRGHHDDERVLRCLARSSGAVPGSEAGSAAAAGARAGAGRASGPLFLGMIGSRAKRTVLLRRLAAEGLSEAWLERVVSPVGLPIGARTAPEIAVSIVAQLIERCRGGGMGGEADRRAAQAHAGSAGPRAGGAGDAASASLAGPPRGAAP